MRLASGERVPRVWPTGRCFGPSNNGLQQTPPSLSLGRRS
jgi:hypothetical protein